MVTLMGWFHGFLKKTCSCGAYFMDKSHVIKPGCMIRSFKAEMNMTIYTVSWALNAAGIACNESMGKASRVVCLGYRASSFVKVPKTGSTCYNLVSSQPDACMCIINNCWIWIIMTQQIRRLRLRCGKLSCDSLFFSKLVGWPQARLWLTAHMPVLPPRKPKTLVWCHWRNCGIC